MQTFLATLVSAFTLSAFVSATGMSLKPRDCSFSHCDGKQFSCFLTFCLDDHVTHGSLVITLCHRITVMTAAHWSSGIESNQPNGVITDYARQLGNLRSGENGRLCHQILKSTTRILVIVQIEELYPALAMVYRKWNANVMVDTTRTNMIVQKLVKQGQ
jgi:hypothetical protein